MEFEALFRKKKFAITHWYAVQKKIERKATEYIHLGAPVNIEFSRRNRNCILRVVRKHEEFIDLQWNYVILKYFVMLRTFHRVIEMYSYQKGSDTRIILHSVINFLHFLILLLTELELNGEFETLLSVSPTWFLIGSLWTVRIDCFIDLGVWDCDPGRTMGNENIGNFVYRASYFCAFLVSLAWQIHIYKYRTRSGGCYRSLESELNCYIARKHYYCYILY